MLVSPSAGGANDSISKRVKSCIPAFESLSAAVAEASKQQNHCLGQISSEWVKDNFDRFKLWSQNIGAHRTGRSSLDYRLRDASNLRKQAVDLVGDLVQALEDGKYLPMRQCGPLLTHCSNIHNPRHQNPLGLGEFLEGRPRFR